MALEAPGRSELGFYFESLLEARAGAAESVGPTPKPEPPLIPATVRYVAAAIMGRNRCESFQLCSNFTICDEAGTPSQEWLGYCEYELAWDARLNIDSVLLPENFPVSVSLEDSTPFTTYPSWQCITAYLGLKTEPEPFTAINNPNNLRIFRVDVRGVPSYLHQEMDVCYATFQSQFPPSGTERIAVQVQTVYYPIISIEPATNRLFIGDHNIDGFVRIQVNSQPQNNGYYDVISADAGEGWIQVDRQLTQEPGGGVVTTLPGIYTIEGDYTAIEDICGNIRMYVGTGHDIEPGFVVRLTTTAIYATLSAYEVQAVGADYVDLDESFLGDDAGRWAAGRPRRFYTTTPRVDGSFSAIAAPAGVFNAICTYTGDVLSDSLARDAQVQLNNMGAYTGQHPISVLDDMEFKLGGTQRYVGDAQGDWHNYAVQLVTAVNVGGFGILRIQGVIGTYDGDYPVDAYIAGMGPTLPQVWFAGSDSGTVQESSIFCGVDGLPTGYDEIVTVQISGTTSYNGIYNNVNAFEFGGLFYLFGGDLDDVFFVGDETGTYEILSPDSYTGDILFIDGNLAEAFTAVTPEKSGNVTKVESEFSRVTVGAHVLRVGDSVVFYNNSVYTNCIGYGIVALDTTTIDIDERFLANDSGDYRSDQPGT